MSNSEVGQSISIFSYPAIGYISLLKLGARQKSGRAMAPSGPPLESPLGITPKRETNDEIHHRGLTPGHHSSAKTSQRRRAVVDNVTNFGNLTGPGMEPRPPAPILKFLTTMSTGRYHSCMIRGNPCVHITNVTVDRSLTNFLISGSISGLEIHR